MTTRFMAYGTDSAYSWFRLAISLAIATIAGIGFWVPVVVLPAIETDFEVDRAGASLPYTLSMIGFAIGSVIMGKLVDKVGIMRPMIFSAVMLGIGFAAASQAPSYATYMAAQAILIGCLGCGVSFGPLVADISHWFRKRRGLAVSIVACGNYLAGAIWPPILNWGVHAHGWRTTYLIVGILCAALMLPMSFFLTAGAPLENKDDPVAAIRAAPDSKLLFGMLMLAGLSCCVAMSMPQVHLVAYCGDLGYSSAVGATMLSLMLGFGVASRLISGFVSDKIGGIGTLLIGSTLQCLALLLYVPFNGLTSLYIVSSIFGLAQGGIVPSYAMIVRDNFPAREAGFRISLVLTCTVLGMALGGWLSGKIFDHTGSYTAAFLHGAAWNLLNLAIAFWLMSRNRAAMPDLTPFKA
jgi:MFS family permease